MTSNQRSDATGEFQSIYEESMFIDVLQNQRLAGTRTIAEKVGCSRRTAHTRLSELEEEEKVKSQKVGNALLWESIIKSGEDQKQYLQTLANSETKLSATAKKGIVLAIQQPHSTAILNGTKSIEFRRTKVKQENSPSIGFIYETSPTKALIGVFEIESIEHRPVSELIDLGVKQTPSTEQSLQEYFSGKEYGTAIFIGEVEPMTPPIQLYTDSGDERVFTVPQNFYYVNPVDFIKSLRGYMKSDNPDGESQQSGSS